jgi:hypothetical protein
VDRDLDKIRPTLTSAPRRLSLRAKKTTAKKKGLTIAKIKKAARGLTQVAKAQKKLDLEIQKHKKHLTAMFDHNGD